MDSSFFNITCSLDSPCLQTDVTTCDRCSKPSIVPLLNTHRRLLREQMAEVMAEKEQLEVTIDRLIPNPELHPLIQQINEWEKQSIDKIHQRAETLRQRLLELTLPHRRQLSQKVQELSCQLIDSQNEDVFIEADLHSWRKKLNHLKTNFVSPPTITIDQYMSHPLVPNIDVVSSATDEIFLQAFDDKVHIEENGQLVMRDPSIDTTEIRERNTYTAGCHRIRLCIERSTNKSTFLGINSQLTPLQSQSNYCSSSYGWSSNHHVWSAGQATSNSPDKSIDIKSNDIISLIFDCDQSLITMINERSKVKHELSVDLESCPLSWQLHVVLYEPNSLIRIL